jgi:ABC-2 type transport system ATP-binding protein
VKLEGCELPSALAARAARDAAGWWRIPIADLAHVEDTLRELRRAGATVASLEVAEPELEEVFVKIMRREDAAPFPP